MKIKDTSFENIFRVEVNKKDALGKFDKCSYENSFLFEVVCLSSQC